MRSADKVKTENCWSTIGVWGDSNPKCDKLAHVIHCRNCSVFTRAGRQAFERTLPNDYIRQWTKELAETPSPQLDTDLSIVIFRLGAEWFALPTEYFVTVEPAGFIHKIPHVQSNKVLGLVNVRGTVRLCLSIANLLGADADKYGSASISNSGYNRFLVVNYCEQVLVFPVDEVGGVHRVSAERMDRVPATLPANQAETVLGVTVLDDNHVVILDAHKVFNNLDGIIGG
jgi:chemotaxis-related protein WspD